MRIKLVESGVEHSRDDRLPTVSVDEFADRPQRRHLAYGHALHQCAGTRLAHHGLPDSVEVMTRATNEIHLVQAPWSARPTADQAFPARDEVLFKVAAASQFIQPSPREADTQ